MRDKIKAALVALAVTGAGVLGVASPAQAAYADCPDAYLCLWTNAYYGGNMYKWSPGAIKATTNHCVQLSSGIAAQASSIANRNGGPSPITFIGTGGSFVKTGVFSDSNLGDTSGIVGWNNRIDTICLL